MTRNQTYCGDGVYATFDGNGLDISVNSPNNPAVYLEPEVLENLVTFLKRCQSDLKELRQQQAGVRPATS